MKKKILKKATLTNSGARTTIIKWYILEDGTTEIIYEQHFEKKKENYYGRLLEFGKEKEDFVKAYKKFHELLRNSI